TGQGRTDDRGRRHDGGAGGSGKRCLPRRERRRRLPPEGRERAEGAGNRLRAPIRPLPSEPDCFSDGGRRPRVPKGIRWAAPFLHPSAGKCEAPMTIVLLVALATVADGPSTWAELRSSLEQKVALEVEAARRTAQADELYRKGV